MKQNYLIILLSLVLGFTSCDDNESDDEMDRLTIFSDLFQINEIWSDMDYSYWKLSRTKDEYGYPGNADGQLNEQLIVSWKEDNNNSKWQEARFDVQKILDSYSHEEQIMIKNLSANTSYTIKLEVYNPNKTKIEMGVFKFKTKPFSINYKKMYPENFVQNYGGYNSQYATFSLEDGTHTLYGTGFNNVPLTINFTSIDNPDDHFGIKPLVLNDSVLSFKVPANIISNDPYIVGKRYIIQINEIPVLNLWPYYHEGLIDNNNYDVYKNPGTFNVFNKDFFIKEVKIKQNQYNSKDSYSFSGYFGPIWENTPDEYILGVPMNPRKQKKFVIKSQGNIVQNIDVNDKKRIFSYDRDLTLSGYFLFEIQRCAGYEFEMTLSKGDYTVQYVCETSDNKQVVSNEFSFKVE